MRKSPIRIVLANDHVLVREAIRELLKEEDNLLIVGEAADAQETIDLAAALTPDVVVVDANIPDIGGVELTQQIKAVSEDIAVLLLGAEPNARQVVSALKAGATGYLIRDSRSEQLINAVHCVHGGGFALHPTIATLLLDCLECLYRRVVDGEDPCSPETLSPLTDREMDVLQLMARGQSNHEIAASLHIGLRTAQAHVSSILAKTGTRSRVEAIVLALCRGWISLHDLKETSQVADIAGEPPD